MCVWVCTYYLVPCLSKGPESLFLLLCYHWFCFSIIHLSVCLVYSTLFSTSSQKKYTVQYTCMLRNPYILSYGWGCIGSIMHHQPRSTNISCNNSGSRMAFLTALTALKQSKLSRQLAGFLACWRVGGLPEAIPCFQMPIVFYELTTLFSFCSASQGSLHNHSVWLLSQLFTSSSFLWPT